VWGLGDRLTPAPVGCRVWGLGEFPSSTISLPLPLPLPLPL